MTSASPESRTESEVRTPADEQDATMNTTFDIDMRGPGYDWGDVVDMENISSSSSSESTTEGDDSAGRNNDEIDNRRPPKEDDSSSIDEVNNRGSPVNSGTNNNQSPGIRLGSDGWFGVESRRIAFFSERELMFMFAICRRLSSVCNVRAPYSGD